MHPLRRLLNKFLKFMNTPAPYFILYIAFLPKLYILILKPLCLALSLSPSAYVIDTLIFPAYVAGAKLMSIYLHIHIWRIPVPNIIIWFTYIVFIVPLFLYAFYALLPPY